jgi:hypothetical protein
MNVVALKPAISRCPICGSAPYIEECAPWPRDQGPTPWAAGCYRTIPFEHFVGVNGDDEADAARLWNIEVEKVAALTAGERQNG